MSAYVIVEVDVNDTERYEDYKKMASPVIAGFGGEYLARGGESVLLEGETAPARVVILRFDSVERAREWHTSEAYREAKALRNATATSRMIVVEGLQGTGSD